MSDRDSEKKRPIFPGNDQHIAIAGRTGSGKTTGAVEMLSLRDFDEMPWVIIDHKRDDIIKHLPAEPFNPNSVFTPSKGLHVIHASPSGKDREDLEGFFERAFNRGKIGIYVDEGHLLGFSQALRTIFVAGRSKKVPIMWISQRAHHIDTFVWSQASFYRVFDLQAPADVKRFNENFPIKWKKPPEYHSYYYDVSKGKTWLLNPAEPAEVSINRLDDKVRLNYRKV